MAQVVDFQAVSTSGLESSPVAEALALAIESEPLEATSFVTGGSSFFVIKGEH